MRDGGYYNDWDFSDEFVQAYLDTMGALRISHVELGFRFLQSKTHSGAWAYSPDEKIKDFSLPAGTSIGVMLNLSEFKSEKNLGQIIEMFRMDSPISFVRVACHYEEIDYLPPLVFLLKKNRLICRHKPDAGIGTK